MEIFVRGDMKINYLVFINCFENQHYAYILNISEQLILI